MGYIYTISKGTNYFTIISCGLKKNASKASTSEILPYEWSLLLLSLFNDRSNYRFLLSDQGLLDNRKYICSSFVTLGTYTGPGA